MSIKELLTISGMTMTQFAAYFQIPYRTVQEWNAERRKCPDYLIALMEYKLRKEKLI